jgi:predicted nucleotidyltransferase
LINLNRYDIIELGLFGSIARNQASSNNDVYICIKTKTSYIFALVHIKDELQKLFSNSIDVVRIKKLYMYKKIIKDLSYD